MHPVLFSCGPLTVFSYGTMLALGFLAGTVAALMLSSGEGIADEAVLDMVLWSMIASIVGARLAYVIFFFDELKNPLIDVFMIQRGGLVFYGGVVGAILALILRSRAHKLSLWKVLDIAAPVTAVGYAIGRIGCFLNGCCYGVETNLPWAVSFPSLPGLRHPTQLYDSLVFLAVFLLILFLWRKRRFDGQVFLLTILFYSVDRFFMEFIRTGSAIVLTLTTAQWFSILVIVLAGGTLIWKMTKSLPVGPPAGRTGRQAKSK